ASTSPDRTASILAGSSKRSSPTTAPANPCTERSSDAQRQMPLLHGTLAAHRRQMEARRYLDARAHGQASQGPGMRAAGTIRVGRTKQRWRLMTGLRNIIIDIPAPDFPPIR